MPLTVVNTRDLHSRGQQHQEGRRDKLITNLIVEQPNVRADRRRPSDLDQDKLNELAGKTLPDILAAAIAGTNKAYADDGRPHGRHPPAAAGRSLAGPALPDADAGHRGRRPADRHQPLRPAGRRGVQEEHERQASYIVRLMRIQSVPLMPRLF